MYSDDKSAMWFLPILGGSMIATGDHDMFIFSDAAIAHSESGGIHDLMTDSELRNHSMTKAIYGLNREYNWLTA